MCKIEKKKLEMALLKNNLRTKKKKQPLLAMERSVILLEMQKSLAMERNEGMISCSFLMTTSDGPVTEKLLKNISQMYS